jgi:hypothetical protein
VRVWDGMDRRDLQCVFLTFSAVSSSFGTNVLSLPPDSCATGFFGKSCTACPKGCSDCDDGLTGSGLCLDVVATNITLPSTFPSFLAVSLLLSPN